MCRAGISVANALGLTSIATGVDDGQQRETLLALGCRYGSGDHYRDAIPEGMKPLSHRCFPRIAPLAYCSLFQDSEFINEEAGATVRTGSTDSPGSTDNPDSTDSPGSTDSPDSTNSPDSTSIPGSWRTADSTSSHRCRP